MVSAVIDAPKLVASQMAWQLAKPSSFFRKFQLAPSKRLSILVHFEHVSLKD